MQPMLQANATSPHSRSQRTRTEKVDVEHFGFSAQICRKRGATVGDGGNSVCRMLLMKIEHQIKVGFGDANRVFLCNLGISGQIFSAA